MSYTAIDRIWNARDEVNATLRTVYNQVYSVDKSGNRKQLDATITINEPSELSHCRIFVEYDRRVLHKYTLSQVQKNKMTKIAKEDLIDLMSLIIDGNIPRTN